MVGGGGEEVCDGVVFAEGCAFDAFAAAFLGAVLVGVGAFGVAAGGDGDDDVVFGDEVFDGHVAVEGVDGGAAVVAVFVDDFGEFFGDDGALSDGGGEDVFEVGNFCHEVVVFVGEFLTFECCEAPELHFEDGVGLDLVDVEEVHEAGACVFDGGGCADEGDHFVEGVECFEECADDVGAFLGFAQEVAGAPDDDVELVFYPVADERVEGECAGDSVDEGEHVGAEGVLELGVFVEVVEDDFGDGVSFEDDDEALAGAA